MEGPFFSTVFHYVDLRFFHSSGLLWGCFQFGAILDLCVDTCFCVYWIKT